MKDIIIYYEGINYTLEVKQRQRILIELSLFMMRSFTFVKMLKQHLHAVSFSSDIRSSLRSEPQQFLTMAHLMSNQLKACSACASSELNKWELSSLSNFDASLSNILLQAGESRR